MMLRATVLLCLVASTVLTQSLAAAKYNGPTDDAIVDYPTRSNGSINGTLRAVPTCAADYARMSIADRKMYQDASPSPHAICVRASNGDFVAAEFLANRQSVFMYDACGWIKKKVTLPSQTSPATGCAFAGTKMFYALHSGKQILQFTSEGSYERVFATEYQFLRLTAFNDSLLYSTLRDSKMVLGYSIADGDLKFNFETVNADGRGLAFDPDGYLHVSTWGRVVEQFAYNGVKVGQVTYSQVSIADGILVDGDHNVIIADRGNKQVLVFSHTGALIKRITGFDLPLDVAMGYQCNSLIVADYERSYIYLL